MYLLPTRVSVFVVVLEGHFVETVRSGFGPAIQNRSRVLHRSEHETHLCGFKDLRRMLTDLGVQLRSRDVA